MDPNNTEELNLKKRLDLPGHGTVPKWLEDMSDTVAHTHATKELKNEKLFKLVDLMLIQGGTEIPSKIPIAEGSTLEKVGLRLSSSAKFGRRASLVEQIHARTRPKHIVVSKSDYLVPKIEGKIDFSSLESDPYQHKLEKSWRSLSMFRQTHKGRLDSANTTTETFAETSLILSPRSSSPTKVESPAIFKNRPSVRSQSEMSNYLPLYVYLNIEKASKETNNKNYAINKSKSSENVVEQKERHFRLFDIGDVLRKNSYFNSEKSLIDYQMRVAEENCLREKIINELLVKNEKITEKWNDRRRFESVSCTPCLSGSSSHLGERVSKEKKFKTGKKKIRKASSASLENNSRSFIIPELPAGRVLLIDILTTWGDRHYVGLNGIEIFDSYGKIVNVERITAQPADVNVLPENENDPRVVTNLLDGINRTQDDVHLWLAPFDLDSKHNVTIEFQSNVIIAMIRIWNYNKSRIHSYRGVRDIVVYLDSVPIFKGEIAKACGGILGDINSFGDTILFTTNDEILEMISRNDESYTALTNVAQIETPVTSDRPPTAATVANRPFTGAPRTTSEPTSPQSDSEDQVLLGANQMDIILLSNWGYANMIGLTSIEVVGGLDIPIKISEENVQSDANSKSTHRLINGCNATTDARDMWYAYYRGENQGIKISIIFSDFVYVAGLRIWNYNQNLETSYAGVSSIKILLDHKPIINPLTNDYLFLLRRAPGNCYYDFVQTIKLVEANPLVQEINTNRKPTLPEGFVFQLILFSTWGDQYYCGLNGIELCDQTGQKVNLEEYNICAHPESINVLADVSGDVRTPDKLIDGVMDDHEGAHSWLAPIVPKYLNRVYVVFDRPVTVSAIKLWNYSKNANRGVKEFAVLVDDLLIYNGILEKFSRESNYRTVSFAEDENILEREIDSLGKYNNYGHQVKLLNNNSRAAVVRSSTNPDQSLRPFTSVSPLDYTPFSQ